jgi:hypothetical protein
MPSDLSVAVLLPDPEPLLDRVMALAGSRSLPDGDIAKPCPAPAVRGLDPSAIGKEVMGVARAGERFWLVDEGVEGDGMCRCEVICDRDGMRDILGL